MKNWDSVLAKAFETMARCQTDPVFRDKHVAELRLRAYENDLHAERNSVEEARSNLQSAEERLRSLEKRGEAWPWSLEHANATAKMGKPLDSGDVTSDNKQSN